VLTSLAQAYVVIHRKQSWKRTRELKRKTRGIRSGEPEAESQDEAVRFMIAIRGSTPTLENIILENGLEPCGGPREHPAQPVQIMTMMMMMMQRKHESKKARLLWGIDEEK